MRGQQAKPTETFFALQFENRKKANHIRQLEAIIHELVEQKEELISAACGWAFNRGLGLPDLTEAELLDILKTPKENR